MMRVKKEMLELEVEKERLTVKKLEAENIKYDRLIDGKERFIGKEQEKREDSILNINKKKRNRNKQPKDLRWNTRPLRENEET